MTYYVFPEKALTRERLPKDGYLVVYATVAVWTQEDIDFGNPSRSGWAKSLNQADEPHEARNDVAPVFSEMLPLNEEAWDELKDIVKDLGPVTVGERGTISATESKSYSEENDEVWMYSIHAHVKAYKPGTMDFTEESVQLLP